jgi:hypothetical protein
LSTIVYAFAACQIPRLSDEHKQLAFLDYGTIPRKGIRFFPALCSSQNYDSPSPESVNAFVFSTNKPKIAFSTGDFTKEFWSGRPGSNRRLPAWEFSIENDVFFFMSADLSQVLRSQILFPEFSDFN